MDSQADINDNMNDIDVYVDSNMDDKFSRNKISLQLPKSMEELIGAIGGRWLSILTYSLLVVNQFGLNTKIKIVQ